MILAEGMIIAERFCLQRELGQGGMGAVWLAHHVQLDTPCAIKFIHADAAALPEIRARFEREARAAAQLRSAHVVAIMDYGVWNDVPYIAMEYLEGEDLAARLRRVRRLSPHETVMIVTQVARALAKAHGAGLVHRDLKPENIFLVREEDQEIAKVLDFGIAKGQQRTGVITSNTRTGAVLGTPHFMSPEQAQGTKTVDFRSDLWSLAVVAYNCVTGQLPFTSEAFGDLLLKIIVNPLPIPSQVASGIPPTFDTWWVHAAAREPTMRFQSAKELAETLSVALGVTAPQSQTISSSNNPAVGLPATSSGAYPVSAATNMSGQPMSGQPMTGQPMTGQPMTTPVNHGNPSYGPQGHGPQPYPMVAAPTMTTPSPAVAHTFNGVGPSKKSIAPFVIAGVVGAAAILGAVLYIARPHSTVASEGETKPPVTSEVEPPQVTAPVVTAGKEVEPPAPTPSETAVAPPPSATAVAHPNTRSPGPKGSAKVTAPPPPPPPPKGDFGF